MQSMANANSLHFLSSNLVVPNFDHIQHALRPVRVAMQQSPNHGCGSATSTPYSASLRAFLLHEFADQASRDCASVDLVSLLRTHKRLT